MDNGQNMYSPGQYPQQPAPMPQPSMPQPLPPHQAQIYARAHRFSLTSIIVIVILSLFLIGVAFLAYWAYSNYVEQKTDVQGKVSMAVNDAVKDQADKDAAKFAEKEKEPYRTFVGPQDYGNVTFDYPKTWSVYVANDVSQNGGMYQAYLNPVSVPPVSAAQQYALRVTIQPVEYDSALNTYSSLVRAGQLKTAPIKINDIQGTRLDGKFDANIRGSAVVFKIRDKTLTIRSDATVFEKDFNKLIQTIKYNQ